MIKVTKCSVELLHSNNVIFFFLFIQIEGIKEHDNEGRLITAEFEKYFVVTSCELYFRQIHVSC